MVRIDHCAAVAVKYIGQKWMVGMDWKTLDREYAKDFAQRMDEATPEPLFESFLLPTPKVCLVCARRRASSALYSGTRLIVPLCAECASDWNVHGYDLLKRVRPKQLLLRLAKYKVLHLFSPPGMIELAKDVAAMARWSKKMKAILSGLPRKAKEKGKTSANSIQLA